MRDSFVLASPLLSPSPEVGSVRHPQLFRKKPVVIEAMPFTEETKNFVFHWITCNRYASWQDDGSGQTKPTIIIETLEGDHTAQLGDWIIKGVKGEFYPIKPEIFAMTYEACEPSPVERTHPDEATAPPEAKTK